MQTFFASLENRVSSLLSVLIALNTLFFIALQVSSLTLFRLVSNNDYLYLGFGILAVLTIGSIAYFSQGFDWKRHLSTILLTWFPGIIILAYGLSESRNFHYVFMIAVGAYAILAGILVSAFYIMKERADRETDKEALTCKQWFVAQGLPTLLLIIFVTGLFFVFGLSRLTEYAAVDEPLWIDGRIARYWKNINERDWKGTNISDKPGITIALATGPGLWFKGTAEYRTLHYQGEVFSLKNDVESFYLAYRLPLLIVITLLLPLFYFFLERLVGRRHALFGYVFIATSPILIGMSKIVNPDSLLWLFTPLSLLSYLVFLRRGSFRYLIFSGILLGFALLTKYVSNILFIFFIGLIFLEYIFHPKHALFAFAEYLKRSLKHLAMLTFAALTTFYVLFPAVWIKPEKLLQGTIFSQAFEQVAPLFLILIAFILIDQWINKARITSALLALLEKARYGIAVFCGLTFFFAAFFTALNTWSGMAPYDFTELLSSPKTIAGKSDFIGVFLANFYPLLFGVTPLVFLSLLAAPFFFLKKNFSESVALRTSFYLIIFILLYYIGATVSNVGSIVRYQIILFPLAAIISGITLEHMLVFIHKKLFVREMPTPVFAALFVALIGAVTLLFTPFPLSYASSFLPFTYHIDVKDMGAGSYEAAEYLNSLPGAKNMLIWTDKDGVCKFFVGRCKRGLDYAKLRDEGLDYIVVSAGRESRTTKMMSGDVLLQKPGLVRFDQYYTREDTEFRMNINNRPSHFVKVFRFNDSR
ncbi:MAG: glycosyltransferase family 39 protein [Candidatus Moraniibacteriota bacterium]